MTIFTCAHCKYRHEDECHRYPPHVSVVMVPVNNALSVRPSLQPSPVAAFPNIGEDSWCGEFSVKMSS